MEQTKLQEVVRKESFYYVHQADAHKNQHAHIKERIRKEYEAGIQKVIDHPEKFGLIRCQDASTLEKRSKLRETIQGIIRNKLAEYQSECDQANWFNNNTPGVGQNIDYKSLPPYPVEVTRLEELLQVI